MAIDRDMILDSWGQEGAKKLGTDAIDRYVAYHTKILASSNPDISGDDLDTLLTMKTIVYGYRSLGRYQEAVDYDSDYDNELKKISAKTRQDYNPKTTAYTQNYRVGKKLPWVKTKRQGNG